MNKVENKENDEIRVFNIMIFYNREQRSVCL